MTTKCCFAKPVGTYKSHRGKMVTIMKLETNDGFIQLLFRQKNKNWKEKKATGMTTSKKTEQLIL